MVCLLDLLEIETTRLKREIAKLEECYSRESCKITREFMCRELVRRKGLLSGYLECIKIAKQLDYYIDGGYV